MVHPVSDQAYFAQALFDPELDAPAGLRTWNQSDASIRFAVYRNNVVVSLTDALADTFPVTQALVGEVFFRAMARVFLQTHPVKSRVLIWLGADFADFIESFPPASSLDYLSDMARLEMLQVRAYHAADAVPIALERLAQALANSDALPELRLTLHPSVHVLQSLHAVGTLYAAHQGLVSIETVNTQLPETILIFRRDLEVKLLKIGKGEGHFLMQLMSGVGLAFAADTAQTLDDDFDLSTMLASLIRLQLITQISNVETPL